MSSCNNTYTCSGVQIACKEGICREKQCQGIYCTQLQVRQRIPSHRSTTARCYLLQLALKMQWVSAGFILLPRPRRDRAARCALPDSGPVARRGHVWEICTRHGGVCHRAHTSSLSIRLTDRIGTARLPVGGRKLHTSLDSTYQPGYSPDSCVVRPFSPRLCV